MYSKQLILKKGVVPTELEESTWRIKIKYISLELYQVNTNIFVIFSLRSRCLICMQYLFLPQVQVNQTPPPHPLFCKLWKSIYREKINILTIMMKTIKKRLNLYTKNILMGWGPVYF